MKALVRAARTVFGGPYLWSVMAIIFVINTVVLFTTYWDRDIVDYVLAVLNPTMLAAAVFITVVKTHDRLKEKASAGPH